MRTVKTTRELPGDPEWIWQVITDFRHLGWRGDLAAIRVTETEQGKEIVETLRDQTVVRYLVTTWEPPREYEQTLTGSMVTRTWGVLLEPGEPGKTKVTVRETYRFKNRLMLLASYPYLPIRGGQKQYLKNLRDRLKELQASPDLMETLKRDKEEYCDAK